MHGPTREAIDAVRSDRARGSEAVSQDALGALADHLEDAPAKTADELRGSTRNAARQLAEARPAMRVVASKVSAAWRRLSSGVPADADLPEMRKRGAAAVRDLAREAREAQAEAARHAREILAEVQGVLTLSDSSTTRRTLEGVEAPVHVLESRPGGEGRRLARELREAGADARLAPDASAAQLLARDDVEAVLFGADGVTREGAVVNKTGSRTLAAAADRAGVPTWVACSTWKCAPGPAPGELADWEPDAAPGAEVRLFEETPPEPLDGIATERGPLRPREAAEVARRRAKDFSELGLDRG